MITAHSHGELLVVARLYVIPEFQRQGIGERLMRESCLDVSAITSSPAPR